MLSEHGQEMQLLVGVLEDHSRQKYEGVVSGWEWKRINAIEDTSAGLKGGYSASETLIDLVFLFILFTVVFFFLPFSFFFILLTVVFFFIPFSFFFFCPNKE